MAYCDAHLAVLAIHRRRLHCRRHRCRPLPCAAPAGLPAAAARTLATTCCSARNTATRWGRGGSLSVDCVAATTWFQLQQAPPPLAPTTAGHHPPTAPPTTPIRADRGAGQPAARSARGRRPGQLYVPDSGAPAGGRLCPVHEPAALPPPHHRSVCGPGAPRAGAGQPSLLCCRCRCRWLSLHAAEISPGLRAAQSHNPSRSSSHAGDVQTVLLSNSEAPLSHLS